MAALDCLHGAGLGYTGATCNGAGPNQEDLTSKYSMQTWSDQACLHAEEQGVWPFANGVSVEIPLAPWYLPRESFVKFERMLWAHLKGLSPCRKAT